MNGNDSFSLPELIKKKKKCFFTASGYNYVLTNCYLNKLIYNCTYNSEIEKRINEVVEIIYHNDEFVTCNISELNNLTFLEITNHL